MSLIHRLIAFAVLPLAVPVPAAARLGGSVSSISADQSRMAARLSTATIGRYARHELVRPNGGLVHEFTNANGVVFAVTWAGPGKPDLSSLLGPYFATFQASSIATARQMHSLRHPPQVSQPDLKIQAEGHMGWFRGVAFIPSLAPAGFSVSDLSEQP